PLFRSFRFTFHGSGLRFTGPYRLDQRDMITESTTHDSRISPGGDHSLTRISRWLPATTLTFGLAASGLVFIAPTHAQQAEPEPDTELLNETSEWNYLDDGTDPANGLDDRTDWAAPEFDDSQWETAPGSFGALRGEQAELSGGYYPDTLLDQYYPDSDGLNKEAFFFRTDVTIDEADLSEDTVLR